MPTIGSFEARRAKYMDAIGENAIAIVRSPPEASRNADVLHPFRQSSDLYYLTGFREPDTTLVLRPKAAPEQRGRHVCKTKRSRSGNVGWATSWC